MIVTNVITCSLATSITKTGLLLCDACYLSSYSVATSIVCGYCHVTEQCVHKEASGSRDSQS
jgi:hypothetical protein